MKTAQAHNDQLTGKIEIYKRDRESLLKAHALSCKEMLEQMKRDQMLKRLMKTKKGKEIVKNVSDWIARGTKKEKEMVEINNRKKWIVFDKNKLPSEKGLYLAVVELTDGSGIRTMMICKKSGVPFTSLPYNMRVTHYKKLDPIPKWIYP